jgi:UDP-GlcNAc:undecaprenyl-phosphate/decaprenyl-phosphate GlcNAc-1-phosphate transferase
MSFVPILICVVLGLATTLALIPVICRVSAGRGATAGAGAFHHGHAEPVSRFGGVALAVAFVLVVVVAVIWYRPANISAGMRWVIVCSSLAMFLLGFWDDLRPLGAKRKLIGQIIIASAACAFGASTENFQNPFTHQVHSLGLWGMPFTVFWLVALTNMINLIDGIDGLAGGIALMLMGLLTYVGVGSGTLFPVLCAAGMFGAVLGFLRYNFPPAKIYLGDGGAYFLGYLIAILALVNSHKGTVVAALIAPLFALALPIVDVSLAIVRRGLKGLPIFRPDRGHIHHKLVEIGVSRRRVVLALYGVSLVFLVMAFGAYLSEGRLVPILFGFMCLALLFSARSFSFSRDWFSVGRVLENSRELRKETQYALALGRWLEMEAERAGSMDSLWTDFAYAAKKLGFAGVRLTLPDGERNWKTPEPVPESARLYDMHQLNAGSRMTLHFDGNNAEMSSRVFEHLAELAAEFWLKAVVRWQEVNGMQAGFNQATNPAAQPGKVLAGAQSPVAAGDVAPSV